MSLLERQLRWLIGIRLVVVTSVVLPYFLLQLSDRSGTASSVQARSLFLLAGLTYLVSLIYIMLLRLLRRHPVFQAHIQFAGDTLLVTGLVAFLGGLASPFSILYLVIISVAASLLTRPSVVIVTTTSYVAYASLQLGLYFNWFGNLVPAQVDTFSIWRLTYNLAIHLFGFYTAAFLIARLGRRIEESQRELTAGRHAYADLQIAHHDVIQSMSSGLLTTDLEGRVTSLNRAAEEILHRSESEILGRLLADSEIVNWQTWQELRRSFDEEGHLYRAEIDVSVSGSTVPLGLSLTHLTSGQGEHVGYILIFQDLTEWRELERELRMKDRMAAVGELAAGIAHEIGNPLAAISGSVQMLDSAFPDGSPKHRLVEIIHRESQRLDRTIKGFLRFARPRERSNSTFDIALQLTENFQLLRNSGEVGPQHELVLDVDPPCVSLLGDPDQISQIFWNLARNALKAMPNGGELRVDGHLGKNLYRFRVADTGSGMTETASQDLFLPFRSSFHEGIGVGMAIVYRIVEEHGGRLKVESAPGEGTCITVELPLAPVQTLQETIQ